MTGATLVVGVGRSDRGDDGVGPAVVQLVASRLPGESGVRILAQEDPTALLDLWGGHDHVVVVDAVVTGDAAGTIHRFDVGAEAPPLPAGVRAQVAQAGTHAIGLGTAVELGRALHRLPARVVVLGVEAGCLDIGTALSSPVADSVEAAAALVWKELAADVPG